MKISFYCSKTIRFCLSICLLSFIGCKQNTSSTSTLFDWIPQDTAIVLELNDQNELVNVIQNNDVIQLVPELSEDLTEQFQNLIQNETNNKQLFFLTNYGKGETALSLVYESRLDSVYLNYKSFDYSGEKVFEQKNGSRALFSTFIDGYALHSDTQIVLENCIRNYQHRVKRIQNENFYRLVKAADVNSPLSIYILPREQQIMEKLTSTLPLFPKIGESWNSYDLSFDTQPFSLDGLIKVVDSLSDPLGVLSQTNARKILLDQVVPQEMISFFSLPLDQVQQLEDQFKKWVRFKNIAISSIDFSSLNGVDEIGLVQLQNEIGVLFHLSNEEEASKVFIPNVGEKKYRNTSYYSGELPKDIALLIESISSPTDVNWVARLDDFILFSSTEAGMKSLIAANKDNKTLNKLKSYQTFKEDELAQKSSLFWLLNTRFYSAQPDEKNKKELWKKWNSSDYPLIGFQAEMEDDYLHLHLRVAKKSKVQNENTVSSGILISLENEIATRPQWLKNHRTKEKDVVIQDINNTLYLFSNTGKLFWKKKLDGLIQGDIQQVDLYKNGRLQMAFRTEDRFYILDRNGKVVAPFSIRIDSSQPIQPLAVFDYDQRRDYRFVLAQGKSLEMYDNRGKKVRGFNFTKTNSPISATPKHIRIDKKDYILIPEENGTLHILSRVGKSRVNVNKKIILSGNEIQSYLKTFTMTDIDGNLIQIDPKGNLVTTPLGLAQGHHFTSTTKSLVTLSENELIIKGLPIKLPFGRYTSPKIFYLNNIIYVSLTDLDTEKVYLYYSDGNLVDGFPVYGSSPIDMINADKDSGLEFVVKSEKRDLIIYEIN